MGMNNVFYRAKHMLGEAYASKPARLRMQRGRCEQHDQTKTDTHMDLDPRCRT